MLEGSFIGKVSLPGSRCGNIMGNMEGLSRSMSMLGGLDISFGGFSVDRGGGLSSGRMLAPPGGTCTSGPFDPGTFASPGGGFSADGGGVSVILDGVMPSPGSVGPSGPFDPEILASISA
jgi:hypothetical protein